MVKLTNIVKSSLLALPFVISDVPTNCPYSASVGKWRFEIGTRGDNSVTDVCGYDKLGAVSGVHEFEMTEQNHVKNVATGSEGTYTTIYNQGFEFNIDGQTWFAYYYFDNDGYKCDKTSVGYVHNAAGQDWGCVQGTKVGSVEIAKESFLVEESVIAVESWQKPQEKVNEVLSKIPNVPFINEPSFIKKLNSMNLPWTAARNAENEKYTRQEHFLRSGATLKTTQEPVSQLSVGSKIQESKEIVSNSAYPENLDWRNMNGENFVSAVDDQGACGSCYAFAAAGMMESRFRVFSGNTQKPNFSEQEVITCAKDKTYNQGCSGGWAFLIAGKYMQEFGLVTDACDPYNPVNRKCDEATKSCKRFYSKNYEYVGGYYGANIGDQGQAMVEELQNGPVAVGFLVTDAFRSYSSGIYVEPSLKSEFNPIVSVNHAVLCVGYGVCGKNDSACDGVNEGMKYWIVKNSWGKSFGEDGYFKIIRGVNELGIESMPFKAEPIMDL